MTFLFEFKFNLSSRNIKCLKTGNNIFVHLCEQKRYYVLQNELLVVNNSLDTMPYVEEGYVLQMATVVRWYICILIAIHFSHSNRT